MRQVGSKGGGAIQVTKGEMCVFEINSDHYICGALGFAGATVYCLFSFIRNVKKGRINSYEGPVLLIIISLALTIFCISGYLHGINSKCDNCGETIDTEYCTNCGTPTHEPESVYVCENCRKEIDTNYCGDCGGKKVLNIPIEVSPAD